MCHDALVLTRNLQHFEACATVLVGCHGVAKFQMIRFSNFSFKWILWYRFKESEIKQNLSDLHRVCLHGISEAWKISRKGEIWCGTLHGTMNLADNAVSQEVIRGRRHRIRCLCAPQRCELEGCPRCGEVQHSALFVYRTISLIPVRTLSSGSHLVLEVIDKLGIWPIRTSAPPLCTAKPHHSDPRRREKSARLFDILEDIKENEEQCRVLEDGGKARHAEPTVVRTEIREKEFSKSPSRYIEMTPEAVEGQIGSLSWIPTCSQGMRRIVVHLHQARLSARSVISFSMRLMELPYELREIPEETPVTRGRGIVILTVHVAAASRMSQPPASGSMSQTPATAQLSSDIEGIFETALKSYKKKTKQDLKKHDLFKQFEKCDSPSAILAAFQADQFGPSPIGDTLNKWFVPTVNVLYAFSTTLGEGVGLVNVSSSVDDLALKSICQAFSPAKVIFAGIGVLLLVRILAAKDVAASQDILVDIFRRIYGFFGRLEVYTGVPLILAMKNKMVEITVEILDIIATATKEMKQSQANSYRLRKICEEVGGADRSRGWDEEARQTDT
ncbi:hypothetical protein H4582DRAFT_2189866 [Lactarius indigo]|nr:hypothetical protein H4582DRAFT_2189866 [Lactarius indigo]